MEKCFAYHVYCVLSNGTEWNESVRDWTCSALLNDAACGEEREVRWNESVRDWTCSALR